MGVEAQNRWGLLKEEYFETLLSGRKINMREVAAKYGLSHSSVRNKSSKEKWADQVEKLREQRTNLLEQKMAERTNMALDKLNEDFATNEAEIRKRHCMIARSLQVRATKRLRELDMSAFGPKDALYMLKLGLEEERRAIGLPEQYVPPPEDNAAHPEYKSVAEQIGGHKRVQSIGMALLRAIRKAGEEIEDVDQVGL